jgi:hypothetical protein
MLLNKREINPFDENDGRKTRSDLYRQPIDKFVKVGIGLILKAGLRNFNWEFKFPGKQIQTFVVLALEH